MDERTGRTVRGETIADNGTGDPAATADSSPARRGRWEAMGSDGRLTERRLSLRYPSDFDPLWTPAIPEFACAANAVSLMMPTIEPYFVRTVAGASAGLDEPLRTETEAYLAQERAHHGQHQRFNRRLVGRYPGLGPVDAMLRRAYGALERTASPRFNLAVVAVSETMAYSAARWAAGHRRELFDRADPVAATLFLWHLAEEVEHKSSAHEVHRAVDGARPWFRVRMVAAMVVALTLVMTFVGAGTAVMLAAERRLHHPLAWVRLARWSIGFAFELLTNLVTTLLPGHHPDDFTDPLWYEVWLRAFDAGDHSVPLWDEVPWPALGAGSGELNSTAGRPKGTACRLPSSSQSTPSVDPRPAGPTGPGAG